MTVPSARPLGIILYGVGALGALVVECLATGYPLLRVVGAVDSAPGKAGRRLDALFPDYDRAEGVVIRATFAECLSDLAGEANVVLHMTESVLDHVEGQLREALVAGLDVISASEAMFHPGLRFPEVAGRLDAAAKAAGVSITGVGINPGFSFDALPLMLARCTSGVKRVTISRTIDVTGTGPGDIDHVGYGLWPAEFDAGIASGRIVGHMGAPDSMAALAERLAIEIDRVEEGWSTETATFAVDSGDPTLGMIEPGRIIGISQTARGMRGDETIIATTLDMYYQPERFGLDCADVIDIEGAHHVRAQVKPAAVSLFGAANTIVNAIHDVVAAEPGLVNALDFSIGGVRRGGFVYEAAEGAAPGSTPLRRRML